MGKFIFGLIIGIFVGMAVVSYNPDLADRMQAAVEDTTGLVLRGTEEAAESVGEAAREAGGEVEQPTGEPAGEAERAPGEAEGTGAGDRPATGNQ